MRDMAGSGEDERDLAPRSAIDVPESLLENWIQSLETCAYSMGRRPGKAPAAYPSGERYGRRRSCEMQKLAIWALPQLRWGRWPKAGWGVAGESVISGLFAQPEASRQTVVNCPTPRAGFAHLPHQVGKAQLLRTSAESSISQDMRIL